jgi:putative Mn2+ efflux pump MntP
MFAVAVLAVALATDAAAAGAVRGLMAREVRLAGALRFATLAAVFQGGMAAFGWLGGRALGAWFARFDHWIAFGLLTALGVKTMLGALRSGDDDAESAETAVHDQAFAWSPLLLLALATSIDALAAGVTVPLLAPPPAVTLAMITGVTFALVLAGVYTGRAAGARLGRWVELAGGAALCAIGVKILVEHLRAG